MDQIEIQTMTWHVSTCHLTDLTRGTILMWHVAWIIFKKNLKNLKNLKKFKKNKKIQNKKYKKMSWHVACP